MLHFAGTLVLTLGFAAGMASFPAAAITTDDLESWENLKEILFEGKTIEDGAGIIALETPYRAMDAAIVPITVSVLKPQTADSYIKDIHVLIDENPSPVAAVFHMTPESGLATISTRVRVNEYTYIRAIAEMNDGRFYMVANFVKAAGGCSAPGLKDKDAAMARLGKMKMKFLKADTGDKLGKAQLLISHPNYSGMQFDQVGRSYIPAHYVQFIEVSHDGKRIFSVDSDISISEDPSIHFYFKDGDTGVLKAVVRDSEGQVFEKSWPVTPRAEG